METAKIKVEAIVSSEISKTWDAYTKPSHITKWNFASEDWHCPKAENNLKAGGKYLARMEAKDGSFGFDFTAIYDEVLQQERLVYTLADGRQASVEFSTTTKGTRITVAFDPESENSIDMQRDGWQAILNNFKKYLESRP